MSGGRERVTQNCMPCVYGDLGVPRRAGDARHSSPSHNESVAMQRTCQTAKMLARQGVVDANVPFDNRMPCVYGDLGKPRSAGDDRDCAGSCYVGVAM